MDQGTELTRNLVTNAASSIYSSKMSISFCSFNRQTSALLTCDWSLQLDISGRAQESLLSIGDDLEIGIQTQVPTTKLGGENYQATQRVKADAWNHIVFRYNRQTDGITVFVDGTAEVIDRHTYARFG